MKKFDYLMILFILLISVGITTNSAVAASAENNAEKEVVLTSQDEKDIEVFDNIDDDSPITVLPDETTVIVLKEEKEFSYIRYEADSKTKEGYVKNEYILIEQEVDENKADIDEPEEKAAADDSEVTEVEDAVESESRTSTKEIKSASEKKLETVTGVALKQPTHIYQKQSQNAKHLKSYQKGTNLKYKLLNDDWYEAVVKVGGKWLKGYIHAADVDHSGIKVQTYHGYATEEPTNVYKTDTGQATVANAEVLKSYPAGSKMKYRSHNKNWYEATVYINGQAETGYIQHSDVDVKMPTLQGYSQQSKTTVYSAASKSSSALKSYLQGQLLKYQPYNKTWYRATVFVNGKKHTGYIHKNDVGAKRPALQGYAQVKNTNVYASTSKNASVLKDYPAGKLLKYKEHNGTWYEATVKVGSKWKTGYIHKSDVGFKPPSFKGYAQMEVTAVYERTSKQSNILKSYNAGSTLKYRSYNASWYEVTVFVKGKRKIGYIHADQIANKMPSLSGFADKNRTAVYGSDSRNSQVIKTYKKGHLLKYQPYNQSWYKAKVYYNGQARTGYIHKNDVLQPVGKTVVIDAGHGGSDPGTSGNGIVEKEVTLDLSLKTAKQLEKSGFNVIMTRTVDEYIALKERTNIANNTNSHLFLSIHVNSGGGKGIETWWYSKGGKPTESKQFAEDIQSEVIKETNATNRGTKDGNFHVNRESNLPSALVEVGFADNKEEAEKMKQNSYKNSLVKGFVKGIKKYFKMPF